MAQCSKQKVPFQDGWCHGNASRNVSFVDTADHVEFDEATQSNCKKWQHRSDAFEMYFIMN